MAIGLNKGDEVIVSSHTMLATASAIVTAGGTPIPVDIDEDGLIDPLAIEGAISPKTVGIAPTNLNGRICRMDEISKIATKYSLAIVEDSAQALGAKLDGNHAGSWSRATSISFYPAKTLGSLGDAGVVLTKDEKLYEDIYCLHDHGRNSDGVVKRWGRNSRLQADR